MKHLLNTLYVLSEDSYLSLDGENVVIEKDGRAVARQPMHTIESIVCFSYKGASPALMGACAKRNIDLSFFSPYGVFYGRVAGEPQGNVNLRQEQYRISDDPDRCCLYARNMIAGKIYNSRWILERATRDHSQRVPVETLKQASAYMSKNIKDVTKCENAEVLRGLEGASSKIYFEQFNHLILTQKEYFIFDGRNRRPPTDPVNALLSFAYTVLANDCAHALSSVGLDPYVGFMHRPRPGRKSLALDLMEEMRSVLADRFVISCINQKIINEGHFEEQESGAVLLNDDGRRTFFKAWQARKQETLCHPFLKEKIQWGLVPYVQALLLARTIRGDLDEYPPLFWK